MFYRIQNEHKMGDSSTALFFMIFVCVLLICESLPLLSHERHENTVNSYPGEVTHFPVDKTQSRVNMENRTSKVDSSIEMRRLDNINESNTVLLKDIEIFTKILFASLQRLKRKSSRARANKHDVIESVTSENSGLGITHSEAGSKTETLNELKNSNIRNKKRAIQSKGTSNISTKDLASVIRKSTPDQTAPEHRNHRNRRSFLHDYGLALSYSDKGDVIFGAHTSPCAHSQRNYCLNGGTCVFVGALEITTCQCKIGYTGLRCQSINQEFLMALLSEEFFG